MDKVYIVTAGSYSDFHIVSVFADKKSAKAFQKVYNSRIDKKYGDKCCINEFPIGADMSLAGKDLYQVVLDKSGRLYAFKYHESVFDYASEIGVVKQMGFNLSCFVAVQMNSDDPEEHAEKIAADLFAEYKARKEGIT